MASYLVVAHQTLGRRELFQRLTEIAATDPEASFELLVPATEPSHLLVWEAGTAAEIAGRKVELAPVLFHEAGLRLARATTGDAAPLHAIADELNTYPGFYALVIISTLPPHLSRWLGVSTGSEVDEQLPVPVTHVVAGDDYDGLIEGLVDPDE